MRPFLLLATRAEDGPADNEYDAFCRFGGLDNALLVRHRLERTPLPRLDLDAWSGIMVGGSPFTNSDPAAHKSAVQVRVEREIAGLLDEVVPRDFPFLGACYGIGSLGTHQGGVVDRTWSEPVSRVEVSLTDEGRADPLYADSPDRFDAFVGHKEAITVLPPTAVTLASSATCPVQAFRVGRHVYATQYHPELDAEGLGIRVDAYRHHGYFAPHEAAALTQMAAERDTPHAPGVLRAFVRRYVRD